MCGTQDGGKHLVMFAKKKGGGEVVLVSLSIISITYLPFSFLSHCFT